MRPLQRFLKEKTSLAYLALLRIFLGYFFLKAGLGKVTGGFLNPPVFRDILVEWASGNPYPWYREFLLQTVIPHSGIFSYLVATAEMGVGLCLLLGLMTRLAAGVGIFLNLNFYLGGGWRSPAAAGINEVFVVCQIVILFAAAGRSLGLDAYLHRRLPRVPLW